MKKLFLTSILLLAMVASVTSCGVVSPPSGDNGNNSDSTPHTHIFCDWSESLAPTCTEQGERVRSCLCGESERDPIPPTDHTPKSTVVTVDPTFDANGAYYEVVSCSVCDEKLSETTTVIPALKHTPADPVTENLISANCSREGSYDLVVYCSVCETELERTTHTISKTDHSFDAWHELPMNEGTNECEWEPISCRLCSICSELETIVGNAKGHIVVTDPATSPSCTASGLTEGKHCSVCDKILLAQEPIPPSHSFDKNVCTLCGYEKFSEGLEYTANSNGTCYVSGMGECTDTDIYIPKTYDGMAVTKISRYAFQSNESITSIVIADGIFTIEVNAFYGCTSLVSIHIPASVTQIGSQTGTAILSMCPSLETISVDENNPYYMSRGNCLIEKSTATLLEGCKTSVIPDDGSVTTIGYKAFEGISTLQRIFIPNCVKTIESDAFYKCTGLLEVTMVGVTKIDDTVFDHCSSLVRVVIPEGVTSIGIWTFNYCTSLESVTIPSSVTFIQYSAFYSCTALKNVYYSGTKAQWDSIIAKTDGNPYLEKATIHYNYVP